MFFSSLTFLYFYFSCFEVIARCFLLFLSYVLDQRQHILFRVYKNGGSSPVDAEVIRTGVDVFYDIITYDKDEQVSMQTPKLYQPLSCILLIYFYLPF